MLRKNYLIIILFLAIEAVISSCSKDNELISRDKYIGTWTCIETQTGLTGSTTFTIRMEALGNEDSLYVYNFNNLGQSDRTIFIVNESSVVIPAQNVTGFTISGTGTLSGSNLSLSYAVDSDNFTAECTK